MCSRLSRPAVVISRAVMATILGLILSFCLIDAFTLSTTSMFSAPEKRDFRMSDMFAQIADNRPVRKFEDRIIIVNIGRGGRDEIAEGLALLSLCGPKEIGVDINFADPGDNDEFLIDAILSNENIVLPLGLSSSKDDEGKFHITDKPFFYEDFPELKYGVVNLPLDVNKGTIREYAISFPTEEGEKLSFVSTLAQIYNPESYEILRSRGKPTGVISYHSREYKIINLDEIENHAEEFADKIVLIGALEDSGDMHATPTKSHVSGIMLHASALSTILDNVWFVSVPKAIDYFIAVSICVLLMLISYGFRNNLKGITLRLIQGLLAFLSVRIGYELFVDHNILLDISFTIMIIAFGFLASDIWNGLETLWNMAAEKLNKLDIKLQKRNNLC